MAPKSRRVPQELRQRTEKSCDRCKSRKQKCGMVPGQAKCAHCVKYGYECLVTKPRKQRLYGSVEAHAERLMLLEGLVKHFVPEADLANTDGMKELARSLGVSLLPTAGATSTVTAGSRDNGGSPDDHDGLHDDSIADHPTSTSSSLVKAKKDNEMLVRDLQGQGQYIGQASSFFFQVRLRDALETWIGRDGGGGNGSGGSAGSPSSAGTPGRMLLFGPNPADNRRNSFDNTNNLGYPDLDALMMYFPLSLADLLPSHPASERWAVTQLLVRTFFDRVNNDFPVLHEATFLEQLGAWSRRPQEADQAWICTLLCVLMLAWRLVAPASVVTSMPTDTTATSSTTPAPASMPTANAAPLPPTIELHDLQEARWWHQAQALLPKVLFTSSMASVQALMLTALHLHNNNSRDVCWTLTGAAVRIGFAIGLHRDDVIEPAEGASAVTTPVARELRKRVWWTLYAFEQLQVSSHDRPSAIDSTKHLLAGAPRETILDMGAHNPPEYVVWSNRLVALLGAACRSLPETAATAVDAEGADGKQNKNQALLVSPLSPPAGLLRDLARWHATLPRHLSADLIEAMPPSFQRPLLLLHVQYNYVSALVSRYALLSRFTAVSKRVPLSEPVRAMADVCIQAGVLSCTLLLKLDAVGGFNALTWMDAYYLYSSVLIVVLAFVCEANSQTQDTAKEQAKELATADELRQLLGRCKILAAKHLANPVVPGTMRRWLTVVGELDAMACHFAKRRAAGEASEAAAASTTDNMDTTGHAQMLPTPQTQSQTQPPLMTPSPDGGNASDNENDNDNDVEEVPRTVYFDNNNNDYSKSTASFFPTDGSTTTLLDAPTATTDDYGPFQAAADAAEAGMWHEMHWEGISDLLLGVDSRSWGA
ncbi:hypothetical protein Sste5346_009813 [Sporothrix stenoceras]|uniref:Zn(2)-C6 fungal-type domain-containing protein n=1 Tax=Sporothrix stenoceras TaxID=5173 RepID=A0ABR3YIH7_9PEZI